MIPTNNTSFLRGAWAITKTGMSALIESLKIANSGIDFADFFTPRQDLGIDENGIAHIDIKGSLLDAAPPIFEKIGSTDYRSIREEIAAAQDARAIMLRIDSPGGTVSGLEEASEAIRSSSVPTYAFCDGMACSAAYHLASSADGIAASMSADVGNIGTVLAWYDDSELLASIGLKAEVITNEGADLKGTFRDSPMSDSQREFLQEEVNAMGEQFRNHVESNREVDPEVFRAGWYSGDRAQQLGLVDAVTTYSYAVETLTNQVGG